MKTLKPALIFISSVLIFFSCHKNDVTTPAGNTGSTVLNQSVMLQLVNDQRQRGCNCGSVYYHPTTTVAWNGQLESAAAVHAADMYKNDYFSHTGLDGSSPGDRIRNAGYNWTSYGENIAKGYTTEQAVMDAWIKSEEHCINIMNPLFTEFGAAKAGSYWVQEFGSR
jgi:uncharacterized protein YkwD